LQFYERSPGDFVWHRRKEAYVFVLVFIILGLIVAAVHIYRDRHDPTPGI
jgi:hypothetical protein